MYVVCSEHNQNQYKRRMHKHDQLFVWLTMMAGRQKLPIDAVQHIQTSVLLNHVEHDVADNTVFSYDNNH